MKFLRLLTVVVLTTMAGGAFGAVVGGLVGFAAPNSLRVFFDVQAHEMAADAQRIEQSQGDRGQLTIEAGVGSITSREQAVAVYGAAIGTAWGLIMGAIIGIGLGVLDQFLLVLRLRWNGREKAT